MRRIGGKCMGREVTWNEAVIRSLMNSERTATLADLYREVARLKKSNLDGFRTKHAIRTTLAQLRKHGRVVRVSDAKWRLLD